MRTNEITEYRLRPHYSQRHKPLLTHLRLKLTPELVDDGADGPVGAVAEATDVVAGHGAHAGGEF